jgi:hypothetical protein
MFTLLCHHLEPIWNDAMRRMHGTCIEDVCQDVANYILEHNPEHVIITQFESNRHDRQHECYFPIYDALEQTDARLTWQEYGYGWEIDNFAFEDIDSALETLQSGETLEDNYGNKITLGGNHSQVLPFYDWISELSTEHVRLCGAFDGECLEDMQIILEKSNVNFSRVESLIL